MSHLISLGPVQIAIAFTFMLIVAGTIQIAKLDFASQVIISSLRCLLQLSLLGIVLQTIFTIQEPGLIMAYVLLMITLAAREGYAKPKYFYRGLFATIFSAFLISTSIIGVFGGLFLVLHPDPFFDPQYIIPLCGMILGNGLTGLALTMDLFLTHIDEKRQHVEVLLAFGGSPWVALRPGLSVALRRGMMPTLNQMTVAGLVSIPGMMTGQVLAGSPPLQAALYQLFIFYIITTCTFFASLLATSFTALALMDGRGRVRFDRLHNEKRKSIADLVAFPLTLARRTLAPKKEPEQAEKAEVEACVLRPPASATMTDPVLRFTCAALRSGVAGRVLLRSIDLRVAAGRAACICGRSGAGKSTMLRILADLVPCDGAELTLNGQASASLRPLEWRREVRYCCTPNSPMEGTPRDLVELLVRLGYPALPDAMELLLCQWEMDLGLLDSAWVKLSNGEAQRMWLAVAIASRPSVLLLDEPTSALDDRSKGLVEATLRGFLTTGGAIVLVTHDRQQGQRLGDVWEVAEAEAAGEEEPHADAIAPEQVFVSAPE